MKKFMLLQLLIPKIKSIRL